jgi:hypothetical protein
MYKYKVFYTKTKEYFYLNDQDSIQEQLKNIFLKRDIYQISMNDFIVEENLCEGCINDSFNQLDHCIDSNGCLYDKNL